MLINSHIMFNDIPIPNEDYYDENLGIQYGKHDYYTQKSKRLGINYDYIRAGGNPIIIKTI